MKEYQRTVVKSIALDSLTPQLQSTGGEVVLQNVVCNQTVNCIGNTGGGFTNGFCSDDFAGGEFFLPGSKEENSPHCSITFNGVKGNCEVDFDQDNTCSDGAFWFISCDGDYNCPQDQKITIHCDGYVDGTCEQ